MLMLCQWQWGAAFWHGSHEWMETCSEFVAEGSVEICFEFD